MKEERNTEKNLSTEDTARLVIDFIHRAIMHHGMWFSEVKEKYGKEKAFEIFSNVYQKSYSVQISRLAKVLGFELKDGIPAPLLKLPEESLLSLKEKIAANWLANDGIWFQAIEFTEGMQEAKLCNDACWASFSPFEAWSIKQFLGLPENPGLEGLKKALPFRLYAAINVQSLEDDTPDSIIFRMNDCRVQSARKRKGLDDYPCKSAGVVEYTTFAESIDSRIKTECIGCPPDDHPEEWYCAWRFTLRR
jgi:hypothetical protein